MYLIDGILKGIVIVVFLYIMLFIFLWGDMRIFSDMVFTPEGILRFSSFVVLMTVYNVFWLKVGKEELKEKKK